MQKFIYAGPSWAVTSYPDNAKETTNIAKEWQLNHSSIAKEGDSVLMQIKAIKNLQSNLPVIFFYCEPLLDLEKITGMTLKNFVQSENWKEIWHQCNNYSLNALDQLDNPVALIGAHSDIDQNNTSCFIIEDSWQKWIAKKAGMKIKNGIINVAPLDGGNYSLSHCWGAEIVHRFLHCNSDINPHPSLLDAIWDIYFFWDELQKRNWFYEVHPNYIANVEFAKYTKNNVTDFINNH